MALIIDTSTIPPGGLPGRLNRDVYCGLDSMVTREVFNEVEPLLSNTHKSIYAFELELQAPALDMMTRGFRVDIGQRDHFLQILEKRRLRVQSILNAYGQELWGENINANSHDQLKDIFYRRMGITPKVTRVKGESKIQMNIEVLEYLETYFYARPLVKCVLALRDLGKKIGVLRSGIDRDRRMRTSYNVGGTETGRWSSSKNALGGGTNLQNITDELRRIFISDPGWKLGYFDLEQAESRVVGLLVYATTGDTSYLDACESGDLHTTTAKLIWPDLGWTGDPIADKKLAEQPFYRHFSYRDMSKRGGHGTNYYGTPYTMAKHLKVPLHLMEEFQRKYFLAFPGIPEWHLWVAQQLQLHGEMTTLFGRHRQFWGRRYDDTTLREAIAYEPQSIVADILNSAMLKVWRHHRPNAQLLAQVHDAIVCQFLTEAEPSIVPQIIQTMQVPLSAKSRSITIPVEAKTGWNWAKWDADSNPHGLKKWSPKGDARQPPSLAFLARRFHGIHVEPPFAGALS